MIQYAIRNGIFEIQSDDKAELMLFYCCYQSRLWLDWSESENKGMLAQVTNVLRELKTNAPLLLIDSATAMDTMTHCEFNFKILFQRKS